MNVARDLPGVRPRISMDSFLTACGSIAPLAIDIDGPGGQGAVRRVFHQPFILIGRDDRADLLLDHDLVSRRHAYLQVIGGRVFFVDLDSRSGTALGGSFVESGWLAPQQPLQVGPYTLRLAFAPGAGGAGADVLPQNPLLSRSPEGGELPRVLLEFQSHAAGHSVWRMSQVLALVGSSPRCKVRLLDSNVSKLHCGLLRTAHGLWVLDLMGRNGITVNSAPVRYARLDTGDVLGLGQVIVRPNFDVPATGEGATGVWGALPRPNPTHAGALPAPHPNASRPTGHPWTPNGPAEAAYLPPARFATDPPLPAAMPVTGSELNPKEPALAMLLNHFGQMQQQMLDQFQQSMMMMFQMVGGMQRDQMTMQREQMDLVREELNRLRELNIEVQEIKAQLAAKPAAAPPPGPFPNRPAPGVFPSVPARLGANGIPPAPGNSTAPSRSNPPVSPPKPTTIPPMEPSRDVHDWLNERLASIQEEEQTRWQRIKSLLKGEAK